MGSCRRIVGVYLAFSLSSVAFSLWYSLFPVYLREMGFETWQVGFVFSLLSLSMSLSYLALSSISDSAGRGKPLALGFTLSALTVVSLLYASNSLLVGFLILVYGLLDGLKSPTGEASIAETSINIGLALSMFYMVTMSSRIIGSALSGYLAISLGYWSLFALAGLLNVLSALAIVALYGLSGRMSLKTVKKDVKTFSEAVRLITSDRRLKMLTVTLAIHGLGFSMVNPLISIYAKEFLELEEQQVGLVIAMWNVGFLLTQVPSGKLTDRLGGVPVLAAHIALSSLSWLLYGFSRNWLWVLSSAVLLGVVGALDMPARRTIMVRFRGSMGMASIIGYMDALTRLVFMLGSSAGGLLWSSFGVNAPFVAAALVNMLALIPLLTLIYPNRD